MRLLLAEDEVELANALSAVLKHKNYSVDAVYNGIDAYNYAIAQDYDGIILDIMMPGMDGIQVLTKLREKGIDSPVLLLTAKSDIDDRITGLDSGADDYLTKPFAMGELLARIRVALKKSSDMAVIHPKSEVLSCGRVSLDKARHEVRVDTELVELTHREFSLLEYLLENKNIVMSRDTLLEKVCGYDYSGETNVIDVYVRYIRTKIDDAFGIKLISTVRGVGYVIKDEQ